MNKHQILNLIQNSIPLSSAPFAELSTKLAMKEDQLLFALQELKGEGIIRQISGIFDSVSLGYQSALVAMQIPTERLARVTEFINHHPGVSHNYLRDHAYNLWFTLTVYPNGLQIQDHLKILSDQVSESTLYLPALRLYKIGTKFNLGAEPNETGEFYHEASRPNRPLMPWEKKVVLALQEDLPLVSHPFKELAQTTGISEEALLDAGKRLQREGFMRRFAAVLRHQKVGYQTNLMTVWQLAEEQVDEVGERLAQLPFVSHCYRRPTYPSWPYNLFAMIHGRTPEECADAIERMKIETKSNLFASLRSLQEFKKIRTRYFTEDQVEWERKYR